jgi:hypothetical protein
MVERNRFILCVFACLTAWLAFGVLEMVFLTLSSMVNHARQSAGYTSPWIHGFAVDRLRSGGNPVRLGHLPVLSEYI